MNRTRRAALALAAVVVLFAGPREAAGHELGAMQVRAAFDAAGGFTIDVTVDEEHLPPGAPRGAALQRAAADGARVIADGVFVPLHAKPAAAAPGRTALRFAGTLPPGAREVRFAHALPAGAFFFSARDAAGRSVTEWLAPGASSRAFVLRAAAAAETAAGPAAGPARRATFVQYLGLGFTHIVPGGLDHVLFVLSLFFFARGVRPLLLQVTAFTVAHSISLGLALYGFVALPARLVEPLIAVSIVCIALQNVIARGGCGADGGRGADGAPRHRVALVFAFGLLHGLGFAGVLRELGLPRGQFATALAAFNIGVEFGQLAVLGAAFLVVGAWFAPRPWYRARVAVPASLGIAAVGAYWTLQRLLA